MNSEAEKRLETFKAQQKFNEWVIGENKRKFQKALAKKHSRHFRICECLAESSECCMDDCMCHVADVLGL